MKITVYNIDGSELASWYSDIVYTPYFRLPNHDARCPYQISFDSGDRIELETGMPLNHAIRRAVKGKR